MIMINTAALGWHEVDEKTAIRFVELIMINSKLSRKQLYEFINQNKLNGITVEELIWTNDNC